MIVGAAALESGCAVAARRRCAARRAVARRFAARRAAARRFAARLAAAPRFGAGALDVAAGTVGIVVGVAAAGVAIGRAFAGAAAGCVFATARADRCAAATGFPPRRFGFAWPGAEGATAAGAVAAGAVAGAVAGASCFACPGGIVCGFLAAAGATASTHARKAAKAALPEFRRRAAARCLPVLDIPAFTGSHPGRPPRAGRRKHYFTSAAHF
jgi:hypothetical protein